MSAAAGAPAPLRLGMVGGGQGAFIGAVHRIAARLDGEYRLVAGALSSDFARAHASAVELGIDPERSYASFAEMATAEAAREDGIEVVAIVTPNHMHFAPAKAFLEAGIHVICDKPLTGSLDEARALEKLAADSGLVFVVTHNYTAYPMIRQAREMVASGALGRLRLVHAEYLQDWLTEPVEATGQKQASWRTDPAKSGAGGATGDIGTHAYNLARFVTGLELEALSADLGSFVEGRRLDDNAHVLLRFKGGAKGTLWASQIAPGNENALTLKVYGDKGGLEWRQEDPNLLWFTPFGEPKRLITRGGAGTGAAAAAATRVPAGHPEGYLEGFAILYRDAARLIRARQTAAVGAGSGAAAGASGGDAGDGALLPSVHDGAEAVAFVEACVRSSRNNGEWLPL